MPCFKPVSCLITTVAAALLFGAGCTNVSTLEQPLTDDPSWRPPFNPATCSYDASDSYEPRSRFLRGPFEGECLDTKTRRPVVVLSTPDQDPDTLSVANLFHDDGFWFATIPTNAVREVYFQLEYFPAVIPAGHTQLRIRFSEPVVLHGQSQWNRGRTEFIDDIVFSVEAVPRLGDSYDLLKGTQDHFGIAYRMTSLEARYQSMVVEQGHHVEQWELLLTEEEKQDLLFSYADHSDSIGLTETYHTLFRNCTTEIVESLDAVVDYTTLENIKKFFVQVTEIYPNIVRTALIARGLLPLDQSTDWYPLEDDPSFVP